MFAEVSAEFNTIFQGLSNLPAGQKQSMKRGQSSYAGERGIKNINQLLLLKIVFDIAKNSC
jgi:hypothetical protein